MIYLSELMTVASGAVTVFDTKNRFLFTTARCSIADVNKCLRKYPTATVEAITGRVSRAHHYSEIQIWLYQTLEELEGRPEYKEPKKGSVVDELERKGEKYDD